MALDFRSLRLRIRALTAGLVDDAAIESVLRTKLEELWTSWDWSFREAQSVLATVAPHSEGTVTLGTPLLVLGIGTAFTAADVGRELIVGNSNSRYTVSAVNVATDVGQQLTLAQPYVGEPFTQETYRLQQSIYALAEDFGKSFSPVWWRQIVESSLPTLDRYDGRRAFSSQQPIRFRYAGVSSAGVQQVEISPVPSSAIGIHYTYKTKLPPLDDTTMIPLREDMVAYLTAADALALKGLEAAEKLPQAATVYVAQADKYQALGQNSKMEAMYADLQLSSPARSVRDESAAMDYSDDYMQAHDAWSPV
jgi:hypothetical protein